MFHVKHWDKQKLTGDKPCQFPGGPGENRTRASAMRMPRNTTLLQAHVLNLHLRTLPITPPNSPLFFPYLSSTYASSTCVSTYLLSISSHTSPSTTQVLIKPQNLPYPRCFCLNNHAVVLAGVGGSALITGLLLV